MIPPGLYAVEGAGHPRLFATHAEAHADAARLHREGHEVVLVALTICAVERHLFSAGGAEVEVEHLHDHQGGGAA